MESDRYVISPGALVPRGFTVMAADGFSMAATHYDEPKSIRQWDYILAEHGGIAWLSDEVGQKSPAMLHGIVITTDPLLAGKLPRAQA